MIKRYWCSPEGVMLECGPADEPCADDYVPYVEYAKLQTEVELLRAVANASRKPSEQPLRRGDVVKLKEDQPIVFMGNRTGDSFPAGERCELAHHVNPYNSQLAVVNFIDHPYRGMMALVKSSNLERV